LIKSNETPKKVIEFLTRSVLINNNQTISEETKLFLRNIEPRQTKFEQIF